MWLIDRWRHASEGCDEAFTAEALGLVNSLYATALRLTRNPAAAEDLVQDTYLKAFRAKGRFAPGTNLKAWILTILHNTWRNRRRDQARSRVEFDSEAVDEASEGIGASFGIARDTPETLLLNETLNADLRCALDALPEEYRQAVWLRDVEGLTYQEIATALEVPMGTVMSRISRGRKQLYQRLAPASATALPHPIRKKGV